MLRKVHHLHIILFILIAAALACNLPFAASPLEPTALPATATSLPIPPSAPPSQTSSVPTATQAMLSEATKTATQPPPTATLPPLVNPPPCAPPPPSGDVYAVVDVKMDDVLNMRSGPGVNNPVVSFIPPFGMDVRVTGPGTKVGASVWVPVQFQDRSRSTAATWRQVGVTNVQAAPRWRRFRP
jgi:hypothetical protein